MNIYSKRDLARIFGQVGNNVQIDKSVHLVSPKNITIGSNVRIDSWCFLSANSGIDIGNHVHIAHGAYLFGGGGRIVVEDFCGISLRATLFTASDDFVGGWLTGPTVPEKYRNVRNGPIVLRKHVVIGAGAVVFPGVTINYGATVGALTLVNKDVPEFVVVAGVPLKIVCNRNKERLQKLEKEFLAEK